MTRQRFLITETEATGIELDRLVDITADGVSDLHVHSDENWVNLPPHAFSAWSLPLPPDTARDRGQWMISSDGFIHFRGIYLWTSGSAPQPWTICSFPLFGTVDATKLPSNSVGSDVPVQSQLSGLFLFTPQYNTTHVSVFTTIIPDNLVAVIQMVDIQPFQPASPCQKMIYMIGDIYVSSMNDASVGDINGYTDASIAMTPNAYSYGTEVGSETTPFTAQTVLDNIAQVKDDVSKMIGPEVQVHLCVGAADRALGVSAQDVADRVDLIVEQLLSIRQVDVTVLHVSYSFTTFQDDFAALMQSASRHPQNYVYYDLHYIDGEIVDAGGGVPDNDGFRRRVIEAYGLGTGPGASLPGRPDWPQTLANSCP